MIVVHATARVKADQLEAAKDAARTMATATEAEAGNISYTFSIDIDDPLRVHLFEEWQTPEALTEHFSTPHMADFVTALGAVLDGGMPTTKYVVSESGPL
jgi:quinol monooxygenase YgiN